MQNQLAFEFSASKPTPELRPRIVVDRPDPSYDLVRSRRKSVAIEVYPEGRVVVRAPQRMSKREIQAFVQEKGRWIENKQRELAPVAARMPDRHYVNGEVYHYLGDPLILEIVRHTGRPSCFVDEDYLRVLTHDPQPDAVRTLLGSWYRDCAEQIIPRRVEKFAPLVGKTPTSIRFRENKRRWGSCNSHTGGLNFNYILMMATLNLVDYIVVHELCHLIESNHSTAFWNQVKRVMPDYEGRRDDLRDLEPEMVL